MKKIIALILVLVFMLLFVSCGDGTTTDNGGENGGNVVGPDSGGSTDYNSNEIFIDKDGNVNLPIIPAT